MTRDSSDGVRPTRRSFLRATGGGAVAAGGSAFLSGSATAQKDEDGEDGPAGYLVITYDDGPIEDYELTFQVHQEFDAPGCVAACPGLMEESDEWLDPDQLREMYNAGWEVMSHTLDHRALGEVPLTADVVEGDTEIAVDSTVHGRYEGDPIVLFDAEGTETEATVVGRRGSGDEQYLELEEPIDISLSAENGARVRYTDEFTHEILAESKARLEGIVGENQVTGFVYPYERHDGLAAEIVPEYYEATSRAHAGNGLNPTYPGVDPFTLTRNYYEEDRMDEDEIAAFLDQIANEPDFGILGAHSHYETLTEERVATTLEMAEERDIEVVTLQEALDTFGIVEAPERAVETEDADGGDAEGTEGAEDTDEEKEGSPGLFERIVAFFRSLVD